MADGVKISALTETFPLLVKNILLLIKMEQLKELNSPLMSKVLIT